MPEQNDDRKPFRRGAPDPGSGRRGDNQDSAKRGGGFQRRADSGEGGGFTRRGESGGQSRRDSSSDRGGHQRRESSGGFNRRGDNAGSGQRGGFGERRGSGDRGGFKRSESGDRSGDTGGFRRGGDAAKGGGFQRRDESAGRSGSGDRSGFKGRSDAGERRDETRGGFRSREDSGARGGSDRGETRGGFNRRREDSGDRNAARRGEPSARGGFGRRGDSAERGDAGRRADSGFQRRDDATQRPRPDRDARRGGENREDRASRGDASQDRRRGGEGARESAGRALDRRPPRPEEPDLPDEVQAADLDTAVRRDLLSLDKGNAETVARHLVMAVRLLDDDPGLALAHARAARQRAGRIAVVRETAGVVAYHAGEWAEALSELRTARRMSGGSGLLAVMADCERGLGRPERAIELGRSDEARALRGDEATELRIVVAGARMDLGQYDQAVVTLQTSDLDPSRTGSAAARLFYAYADALVAAGRTDEGLTWFLNAASADLDGETDAEERAAELTGENNI